MAIMNAVNGRQQLVQFAYATSGSYDSTTSVIPFDDTIPQSGEGKAYLSQSITPLNANNILVVEGIVPCGDSANGAVILSLFSGASANALAAEWISNASWTVTGGMNMVYVKYSAAAGGTSSITYSLRYGTNNVAITASVNGFGGVNYFGGSSAGYLLISEYLPG